MLELREVFHSCVGRVYFREKAVSVFFFKKRLRLKEKAKSENAAGGLGGAVSPSPPLSRFRAEPWFKKHLRPLGLKNT